MLLNKNKIIHTFALFTCFTIAACGGSQIYQAKPLKNTQQCQKQWDKAYMAAKTGNIYRATDIAFWISQGQIVPPGRNIATYTDMQRDEDIWFFKTLAIAPRKDEVKNVTGIFIYWVPFIEMSSSKFSKTHWNNQKAAQLNNYFGSGFSFLKEKKSICYFKKPALRQLNPLGDIYWRACKKIMMQEGLLPTITEFEANFKEDSTATCPAAGTLRPFRFKYLP